MALTAEQIQQIQDDQNNQLTGLYTKETLSERLKRLSINNASYDVLFGKYGCIPVDIDDWIAEFGGDKQAAANALRIAASQTISQQEFSRFLNSIPANVRKNLQNVHDAARNNTMTIEKQWDVRNEIGQLVPMIEKVRKPMIENLIGQTEGEVTAEKTKEVQDLITDYLLKSADKIAGPAVSPQPGTVPVPVVTPERPVASAPVVAVPAPNYHHVAVEDVESNDEIEFLPHSDREFMQDLALNNSFIYSSVIGFMQLQFNSRQEVKLDLCLNVALLIYDAQEKQALLLVQQISASVSISSANHPNSFFSAVPGFRPERLSTCAEEARQSPRPSQDNQSIAEDFTRLMTAFVR